MKIVQHPRMNTATANAYLGPAGQIIVDTERDNLRLHNGLTVGGKEIPNIDQVLEQGLRFFSVPATVAGGQTIPPNYMGAYIVCTGSAVTLPLLSDIVDIGAGVTIYARVAITLNANGGAADRIIDVTEVPQTSISLANDETILIAKYDSALWKVINRY